MMMMMMMMMMILVADRITASYNIIDENIKFFMKNA
jgi:hypothetical protein